MPDKAIMDRLLAAKRGAALVCDEFESDRAAGTLDASRVESLVRRFILAKFPSMSRRLRLRELAWKSLRKRASQRC